MQQQERHLQPVQTGIEAAGHVDEGRLFVNLCVCVCVCVYMCEHACVSNQVVSLDFREERRLKKAILIDSASSICGHTY